MSAAAIILAAGLSTRMGRCKASLPWLDGHTLLSYQVQQWQQAGCWPIVVLGRHNADHGCLCPDTTQRVVNETPEAGKTHSIRLGLAALPPDCSLVAISAVDQPRSCHLYQTLVTTHQRQAHAITAPIHAGRIGHPLIFAATLLPHLAQIKEETQGLRQLMAEWRAHIGTVDIPSQDIHADLNTPATYKAHLGQCRRRDV